MIANNNDNVNNMRVDSLIDMTINILNQNANINDDDDDDYRNENDRRKHHIIIFFLLTISCFMHSHMFIFVTISKMINGQDSCDVMLPSFFVNICRLLVHYVNGIRTYKNHPRNYSITYFAEVFFWFNIAMLISANVLENQIGMVPKEDFLTYFLFSDYIASVGIGWINCGRTR